MGAEIIETDKIAVYNCLINLGVCTRCILRFLGYHVDSASNFYKKPDLFCKEIGIEYAQNEDNTETDTKKLKKNACRVCLDCFNDSVTEKTSSEIQSTNIKDYQYDNYNLNISFPKSFLLRTYSMYLYLKDKFPAVPFVSCFSTTDGSYLEQPSKIFRLIAVDKISAAVNKTYHPSSHLSVLLTLGYTNDESEVDHAKNLDKSKFVRKKKRKYKGKREVVDSCPVSRNILVDILTEANEKSFRNQFDIPPSIPEAGVFVEEVSVESDPIYLGGRYLKFSRNIGQTPWTIDGKYMTEHSIEELISEAVSKILSVEKNQFSFCASGREDADARMLGSGRPFYLKIANPKQRQVCFELCRAIEQEIIKTKMIAVIKLQSIYNSDLRRIKFGEEHKTKTYNALCHTFAPDVEVVINEINTKFNSNSLDIVQNTPVRVLHRRTLMERKRKIYMMKAKIVPGSHNLFELEMKTQAGTYVKEFVNGDFDRTMPNISSLIGYPTDVVALDVTEIDLVWPEKHEEDVCNPEDKNTTLDCITEDRKDITNKNTANDEEKV